MLEGLLKGLTLWLYGLILSGVEYISNALLDVFQMDMTYFETAVPVSKDIFAIIVAVGWALLIGNLTFQAMKTMASGIGFEGEDPKILFCRTFVFGFLLLASRQICEIGMSISSSVIDLLQVPTSVAIPTIAENSFSFDGSWLLVIIVGIVMMFQIRKIDDIVSRIGMNSARTGDPLGKGNLPGMLTMMVAKQIASAGISRSSSAKSTNSGRGMGNSSGTSGSKQKPASAPHSSSKSGANSSQQTASHSNNFSQAGGTVSQNASQNMAQNMSNANNSQANNSAQMAASIAGNVASSTMAGTQAGKVSSANPTRPPSRNIFQKLCGRCCSTAKFKLEK